jgi:hypothetical protein
MEQEVEAEGREWIRQRLQKKLKAQATDDATLHVLTRRPGTRVQEQAQARLENHDLPVAEQSVPGQHLRDLRGFAEPGGADKISRRPVFNRAMISRSIS